MTALDRERLPLADYDELPEGALRERVRALTEQEVNELLDYEEKHANRPVVTAILRTRLGDLREGAEPSGTPNGGTRPSTDGTPHGGSRVSPATAAEPAHSPPHGHPAQPAKPKGNQTA